MSRLKLFSILVVAVALLAIPILAFAAPAAQTTGPITVTLDALNNSGETGTATLTDLGNGQTQVDITVTGAPAGVSEPEHIHQGTCTNLNPTPQYPLNPLVDGKSSTTITASLASLMDGNHAVNLHKSAAEATVYVACGNIPAAAASAATTATTAATMAATAVATPTMAATMAATAAATTAATAAATPAAMATPAAPSTAPTTGGDAGNLLLPVFALALLALGAGIFLRRASAKS